MQLAGVWLGARGRGECQSPGSPAWYQL